MPMAVVVGPILALLTEFSGSQLRIFTKIAVYRVEFMQKSPGTD
jgi:hypothetical protein